MTQANIDPAQAQRMAATMVPIFGVFVLLLIVALIVPLWVAFKKAGHSPWLSMLIFIPGIGVLVTLYVLAFITWRVTPVAPDYTAYPPQAYPPQSQPPQLYTQPGAYTPAPSAYPPVPQAPAYPPPTDPSREA